jgi:signal transduction histidine kinase
MDLRGKLKSELDDLKRGFDQAMDEEVVDEKGRVHVELSPNRWIDLPIKSAMEIFRVMLYGFILASPGVPLVPWGHRSAILVSLVALGAAVVSRFHRDAWLGIVALLVAAGCMSIVTYTGVASTSILVAGAIVAAIINTAMSRPYVYGVVAAIGVVAIATQTFDLHLFPADELVFTGRPWTPDGAGRQGLLLAAFVFINAMFHLSKIELDHQRLRTAEAEQARDVAVASERARIARELHDVVSHHVTAMTLQAEAAAATGDERALQTVAASGREALTELRRMLGVLRQPDADLDAPARPTTEPQPDLSDLDALARRAAGGLDIVVHRVGEVRPLPAGVELCAYRLVQESITNSSKHSDARHVEVTLTYGDSDLAIEVVDDGRALSHARVGGGGHGLVGMGERVALLDGELSTGSRPGSRGYQVLARLPLQG